MSLGDLIQKLDEQDNDATIYVDRSNGLGPDSPAAALVANGKWADRLSYLLEVDLAKEVLEVWSQWRGRRQPSLEERCRAVIWYADHDAYMPVEMDP